MLQALWFEAPLSRVYGRRNEGIRLVAAPPRPVVRHPAKVARLLALAYHFQRLIGTGRIPDRAELARRLGWSRARVTQVLDLLLLAPDIQEEVLFAERPCAVSERALRAIVRHEEWSKQRAAWVANHPRTR